MHKIKKFLSKYKNSIKIQFIFAALLTTISCTDFQNILFVKNYLQKSGDILEKFFKTDELAQIDKLFKKYAKWGRFNGSILITSKGIPVYNQSFGYSNLKNKTKLNNKSIFQLASLSKQFTAVATIILKEKKMLDYDNLVTNYFPDFPYPTTTIRHLLNHTSGLPNYMWFLEHRWKNNKIPYNDDMIKLLSKTKKEPNFKPGTRFAYSNTGYAVLAAIIEKISKQRFHKFVAKNIFNPLKMNSSFVHSTAVNNISNSLQVNSYLRKRGRYRRNSKTIHDGIVGDKGVYSTINDLLKWDNALYFHKLISKDSLNEAFTRLTLKNKYHWHYGFGFRIKGKNQSKLAYHFGRWNSFHTYIGRYLGEQNTVIILSNMANNIHNMVRGVENILGYKPEYFSIIGP